MCRTHSLPLFAFAFALSSTAQAQSVNDYELPPKPTPTPTSQAQGPVDTESGALPVRPRVIETEDGQPAPGPDAEATADVPLMIQPLPSPDLAQSLPPESVQAPLPRPLPSSLPTGAQRLPLGTADASNPLGPAPETPTISPMPDPPDLDQPEQFWWPWFLVTAGGVLLFALALAFLFARRQRSAAVPEIERPRVGSASGLIAPDQIKISAEAIKLTRSLMNATLQYRISLINRSGIALNDVALGADIVSAHGDMPVDQQVANVQHPLEKRHSFARIAPGQSVRYEGQLTIPLSQAKIIQQGAASLFVPLLRVRLDGATGEPVVKTFVVGLGAGDGGRVMPFRIDEGPRSYQLIAARALD